MKWENPQQPNQNITNDKSAFGFWLDRFFLAFVRNDYNFDYTSTHTSSSDVLITETVIFCDCTSGNIVENLPAQADLDFPKRYVFVKTDSGSNTVTFTTADSATVKCSVTASLATQYAWIEMVADGTDWIVTSIYQSVPTLPTFRGCLVYLDADQSISDSTTTAVNFDQESYDTDSIHDNATNNTRLTVPSGVSKIRLSARVNFAGNATGYRRGLMIKNGGTAYHGNADFRLAASMSDEFAITFNTPVIDVSSSDYFELNVAQTSGGALNLLGTTSGWKTWFAMEIIE